MKNITLVVMAAGIGSRFGGGIKQLEPVGPNGEIIMDYSIHDAIEAGFNKVVFVIRKDLEKDFEEVIGNRIRKKIHIEYAFQEKENIPECYQHLLANRQKPWGTGQAILSCKGIVNEPFLVINADDYYGKEAYVKAYEYLSNSHNDSLMPVSMVGFVLKNTLSDNGGVTRGVCKTNDNNQLIDIVETHNIEKKNGKAYVGDKELDSDSVVSMNMWGLQKEFIDLLEDRFELFLSELTEEDVKKEFLLPTIIGELLQENKVVVNVLKSHDSWFGVTYKEDKAVVKESILELIQQGVYPENIH